jgi:hypothetical protein
MGNFPRGGSSPLGRMQLVAPPLATALVTGHQPRLSGVGEQLQKYARREHRYLPLEREKVFVD